MVDIKELMRTYVMINDPDVREVTTKFGMLLIALGVAGLAVWGAVNVAHLGADVEQPTAQQTDGETQGEEETTTDCVPGDQADAWREANADIVEEGRLVTMYADGDEVCYTYTT